MVQKWIQDVRKKKMTLKIDTSIEINQSEEQKKKSWRKLNSLISRIPRRKGEKGEKKYFSNNIPDKNITNLIF